MWFLKKAFVLAIIASWALLTHHCELELLSGLEFLACSAPSETTPHQPKDCGNDNDACATVESGLYRAEEEIATAKAPVAAVVFTLATLSDLNAIEPPADKLAPGPSPPELARVWQFSFRTAPPPRAPSLLS